MHSLQPAIDDSFVKEIEKMDGIQDFHIAEGTPISFPYHPGQFF